jgi:hypothetical protein
MILPPTIRAGEPFLDGRVSLRVGDCRDVLAGLAGDEGTR